MIMATGFDFHTLGVDYAKAFTEAYIKGSALDKYSREILCEDVQFPLVLVPPKEGELLFGRRLFPEFGYSVQYGGLGY